MVAAVLKQTVARKAVVAEVHVITWFRGTSPDALNNDEGGLIKPSKYLFKVRRYVDMFHKNIKKFGAWGIVQMLTLLNSCTFKPYSLLNYLDKNSK